MILLESGINWNWYYDTEKMVCWREHKNNIITKHDTVISFWGNEKGQVGINLNHFKETGERISYVKNTIQTTDGDNLSFNINDFKRR